MKNFWRNIKSKSNAEKRVFAFWLASAVTFFIFSIWIFNLAYSNNLDYSKTKIQNQASSIFSDVSKNFNELKSILNTDK